MVATTEQTQAEARIRELMAEQESAMRARDAERLVARFAPEVVSFSLAPPLRQAAADARDVDKLRNWFAGFDGPIEYEIRDLAVTVGEDIAYCHSLNRLSTTPHGSPKAFNLWFRSTVCLRKVDEAWMVTHEHLSTPFYMDGSFKSAVDLEP